MEDIFKIIDEIEDVPIVYKIIDPENIEGIESIDLDFMYDMYYRHQLGDCEWFGHPSPYIENDEVYLELSIRDPCNIDPYGNSMVDKIESGEKINLPKKFEDTFCYIGCYSSHKCIWEFVKWNIPDEYKKYFNLS